MINAPSGTPIKPKADNKPRSLGAAQFALVLLIVENIGPSDTPNSTLTQLMQNRQIKPCLSHQQMPYLFQIMTKVYQQLTKQILAPFYLL